DFSGVSVFFGSSTRVGNADGGGNVISRNLEGGVALIGCFAADVNGNAIGTGFEASEFVGNFNFGVLVENSEFCEISMNRIFFNDGPGVVVDDGGKRSSRWARPRIVRANG